MSEHQMMEELSAFPVSNSWIVGEWKREEKEESVVFYRKWSGHEEMKQVVEFTPSTVTNWWE